MKDNRQINNSDAEKALVKVVKGDEPKKSGDIDMTFAISTYDGEKRKKAVKKVASSQKIARQSEPEVLDPYEMGNYKNVRVVTTKKKTKGHFPLSMFFAVVSLAIILLFLMMNYAVLDRTSSEIASMKSELAQLKRSEQTLSKQLDERDDLKLVEDYAKNTLGMVKKDTLTPHAVSMTKADKSEVIEYGAEDENKVLFLLSGIGRVFSNFFGGKS